MRETYKEKRFQAKSLEIIDRVNKIVSKYEALNLDLTLRQVYYQFVGHDYFPPDRTFTQLGSGKWVRDPNGVFNAEPNYDWLGELLNDAKLAGLVDWDIIKDRGRESVMPVFWDYPRQYVEIYPDTYQENLWENQPNYVEVMVEKQALEGILEPVCRDLMVGFTSNKGYVSSPTLRDAGKRFINQWEEGKKCHVIYLGDHDPSGIDMSRDIQDRLDMFAPEAEIEVHRVALNLEQVRRLRLLPNPTKLKDCRAPAYVQKFGLESWELDAVEPTEIGRIVRQMIRSLTDNDILQASLDKQEKGRRWLQRMSDRLDEMVDEEGEE